MEVAKLCYTFIAGLGLEQNKSSREAVSFVSGGQALRINTQSEGQSGGPPSMSLRKVDARLVECSQHLKKVVLAQLGGAPVCKAVRLQCHSSSSSL